MQACLWLAPPTFRPTYECLLNIYEYWNVASMHIITNETSISCGKCKQNWHRKDGCCRPVPPTGKGARPGAGPGLPGTPSEPECMHFLGGISGSWAIGPLLARDRAMTEGQVGVHLVRILRLLFASSFGFYTISLWMFMYGPEDCSTFNLEIQVKHTYISWAFGVDNGIGRTLPHDERYSLAESSAEIILFAGVSASIKRSPLGKNSRHRRRTEKENCCNGKV